MKSGKVVHTLLIAVCILGIVPASRARAQGTLTFSGHIKTKSTPSPRFTVKLYPPKTLNKSILITTSDYSGNFQITLSAGTYLLEIYLGTDLIYQEILDLKESICCEIDFSGDTAKKQCPCPKSSQLARPTRRGWRRG